MSTTTLPNTRNSSPDRIRSARIATNVSHNANRALLRIIGPLLCAAPFVALAVITTDSGFVSTEHAHIVTDTLIARQQNALQARTLEYPPLVSLVAFVHPTLMFLRVCAAFCAGVSVWVVWRQLQDAVIAPLLRLMLVASFVIAPALLFQGVAELSEAMAAMFLFISWRYYIRFVYFGITWNGFAAGLILALAFFSNFAAVFFVIPFALAAPATLLNRGKMSRAERWRSDIAGVLVIGFPAVFSFFGWCYIDWTFTGNPFLFSSPAGAFTVFDDPNLQSIVGLHNALAMVAGDMLRAPLYPLVALLMARRGIRSLAAYAFPLLLITAIRIIGVPYSESFAIVTYLGFALVSCVAVLVRPLGQSSPTARRVLFLFLLLAATTQLIADVTIPMRNEEARSWNEIVIKGQTSDANVTTRDVAQELARQPDASVLADDTVAYRIIALGGTVSPYILPSNARFDLAQSDPQAWVDHILVATSSSASDELYQRFSGDVPGFSVDVTFPGWRVLTKDGAPSISL